MKGRDFTPEEFRAHRGHLGRLLDPTRKVFEGEIAYVVYQDRIEATGRCFHCRGEVTYAANLRPGQSDQYGIDRGYAAQVNGYCADQIQKLHQCGALLHDGKDELKDLLRH